jgi:Phosphotransferase enzyme family
VANPEAYPDESAVPFSADHGWLAAVIPAEASRFRVFDADIGRTLRGAGAELVESDPDVEIGSIDDVSADAPLVVANLDASPNERDTPVRRSIRRITGSVRVRMGAERVRIELKRRGYRHVSVLVWDRYQMFRLPGLSAPRRLSLSEWFPCRAAVVASRRPPAETAFERAATEASKLAGWPLHPAWPLPRAGGLVALGDRAVLRVASGGASRQIHAQAKVLEALAAARPPISIAAQVPQLLAQGHVGVTSWSLERRLSGESAPHSIDGSLLGRCIEFLAELFRLGDGASAGVAAQASAIEGVLPPDRRRRLRELAGWAELEVAELPLGFGHGDFCTSNLLVQDGLLTGVIDWEAGGSSYLPAVDIFHLHLLASRHPNVYQWGAAIVEHLLPTMRAGGDSVTRAYLAQLSIDAKPPTLEALVAAYWLGRVHYHLATYLERRTDPFWIERNVIHVLDALARS